MAQHTETVLVVDDDAEWTETLTDFLEEEGYSVAVAPNGVVALKELSRVSPIAVVTDLRMPLLDGRGLLGRVRARAPQVPVIVLTAEHDIDGDPRLAGAFRVIPKPVPVEDLLSALAAAKVYGAASAGSLRRASRISSPALHAIKLT